LAAWGGGGKEAGGDAGGPSIEVVAESRSVTKGQGLNQS